MSIAVPTLRTPRLILRAFHVEDLESLTAMHSDPEVMRFTRAGRPLSREATWNKMALYLGHWQLLGYGKWAVAEKESGQMIGRVGLSNPEGSPGPELGWLIAHPYWGRGFATEAASAALRHAFATVGIDHVISIIQERNLPSIRVAEKLGESLERIEAVNDTKVLTYGIAREQWELRGSQRSQAGERLVS